MLVGGLDGQLSCSTRRYLEQTDLSRLTAYHLPQRCFFFFSLTSHLASQNFIRAWNWEPLLHRIVEPQSGSVAPRPAETTGGMRWVAHRPFCNWKFLVPPSSRAKCKSKRKKERRSNPDWLMGDKNVRSRDATKLISSASKPRRCMRHGS